MPALTKKTGMKKPYPIASSLPSNACSVRRRPPPQHDAGQEGAEHDVQPELSGQHEQAEEQQDRRTAGWSARSCRPPRETIAREATTVQHPLGGREPNRDQGDHENGDQRGEPAVDAEEDRDRQDGEELADRARREEVASERPSSRPCSRRMGSTVPSAVVVRARATGTKACTYPTAARRPTTRGADDRRDHPAHRAPACRPGRAASPGRSRTRPGGTRTPARRWRSAGSPARPRCPGPTGPIRIPPRMSSTTWGTRILGISADTTGASADTAATTNSSVRPSRMSIVALPEPEPVRESRRRRPRRLGACSRAIRSREARRRTMVGRQSSGAAASRSSYAAARRRVTCHEEAPSWLISWNARFSRYDAWCVGSTSRTSPVGVHVQPGRYRHPPDAQQQVVQAIDHLDRGRGLVDRRRQRLGRHVDELPDPEGRVLVERAGAAEVEAGQHLVRRGVGPPWTAKTGPPVGTYSPIAGKQLDHAVVPVAQPDEPRPVHPQHRAEHALEAAGVGRAEVDHVWLRGQRWRVGEHVGGLGGGYALPDRHPGLVRDGRDHPADLEQPHGRGDVDDEDDRRPRPACTTAAPTVRDAAAVSSTLSNAIPVTANAKVARKTPKAVLVTSDRTKVRMTRGESWELASWSPTRVIAKTTPTKVSIEDAITSQHRVRRADPDDVAEVPVGRQARAGRAARPPRR